MLMLHISDIHFRSPQCLVPEQDPDSAIRTRMMRDLVEQVRVLGSIGAILIGGDVAFKGAPDEYATAWKWIQQLAVIAKCPLERIFVVPGNHDVDRSVAATNVPTQNAQHVVATASAADREWRLSQQLGHEASGQSLLLPHAAYNQFAAPLMCQIWPEKPFWHQDIELDGGVKLRIHGLTSTLLSGRDGKDDAQGSLYVGPRQTVLDPAPNTANMVLVHHPIDWLVDGEAVDDALTGRAAFHLFGHKHKQRAVMTDNYVRIGAGAINPSRAEQPYLPGYNLINLQVEGVGADRRIEVTLHQRRLQDNPEIFVPILTQHGLALFRASILVPEEAPLPVIGACSAVEPSMCHVTPSEEEPESVDVQDAEAAMGESDNRDLLYRFWSLTSGQRRRIALDLDLLERDELRLPEPERYGRALIRAGERNLINEVAAAVARLEN
ncbi:metallophosphoesterase [Stenotrophomonas sp. CFBP8980]|uniref:metallophosphoesterase n=1 Tax=Stenotrophomonas sp. CFBP8980 TaxID=3096523 RepID=UPI002A69FBE1|nr:metallophosphoesterase [Stenotrophomonas sp. CFBP8980]MDY1032145.1 metallophosphoesterase [Stenotrophomonas sp. CFBP8980]